jgi:putative transposase
LSEQYPRYGYRRITALLRRKSKRVNPKRVQWVRRQAGFQASKRQRRMRRLGPSSPKRLRTQQRTEIWSCDLLYDQTEQGRSLRILTLIDEYTKECLAIHAGYSMRAVDAITVLEAAIQRYGTPKHLRSDNGPEFMAQAIRDWVRSVYVQPGAPWEQAYIGKLPRRAVR